MSGFQPTSFVQRMRSKARVLDALVSAASKRASHGEAWRALADA